MNQVKMILKRKGCHNATIIKANMKARYRGLKKVRFQVDIRALAFNLKRLMALGVERIALLPV